MLTRRLTVCLLLIVFMLSIAGCEKTWVYDFAEQGLGDWGSEEISEIPGEGQKLLSPGTGLVLSNYTASTPITFGGDLTVEVDFMLDVNEDELAHFEIYIADGTVWRPENYIHSMFDTIGKMGMEYWQVSDFGSTGKDEGSSGSALTDLNRQGPNTFKLIKTGDNHEVYMNTQQLTVFNSVYCRSNYYYLTLSANLEGGGSVVFNDIRVKYDGGTN